VEQSDPSQSQINNQNEDKIVPRGTISNKKQNSSQQCSTWNITETQSDYETLSNRKKRKIVPRGTIWVLFNIIIFLGLFQAIIGIVQFYLQNSIGLFWLKESLISPNILGVAKVVLDGETYVRAYGLMPHPNVLGGFLLFSIIITLLYKKLFHVEHSETEENIHSIVPRGTLLAEKQDSMMDCSTPAPCNQNVPRGTIWYFRLILAIQILALILTFSKSALIGLIIALVYISVPRGTISTSPQPPPTGEASSPCKEEGAECSTWNIWVNHLSIKYKELFHVEHLKSILLSILIILLFIFIVAKPNLDSLFFKSLEERILYLNVPRGTFESDPILGVGAGQSVISMQKFYPQTLEFWEFQPVHNVFLLILSELGLVGLGLFIWWLWKLFHVEHWRKNKNYSTPAQNKNVPRGTKFTSPQPPPTGEASSPCKEEGVDCSTWNNFGQVEQSEELQKGTSENNKYILHNNIDELSRIIILRYFTAILLGLIFIMLFDHYLWDIQQGSFLLWLTAGFVAGIRRKYY
jgi:hypothetical protein